MEVLSQQSRFAALLEPIKDLAEVWNLDLATQLSDYLEELEELEVSFGNVGKFSFVEAGMHASPLFACSDRLLSCCVSASAMLLQGSTAVYSKRVEYLYQFVSKTLELCKKRFAFSDPCSGHELDHPAYCVFGRKEQQEKAEAGEDGAKKQQQQQDMALFEEPEFIELDDLPMASEEDISIPPPSTAAAAVSLDGSAIASMSMSFSSSAAAASSNRRLSFSAATISLQQLRAQKDPLAAVMQLINRNSCSPSLSFSFSLSFSLCVCLTLSLTHTALHCTALQGIAFLCFRYCFGLPAVWSHFLYTLLFVFFVACECPFDMYFLFADTLIELAVCLCVCLLLCCGF